MTRIVVIGIILSLLFATVLSSASTGLISQIPEMSRKVQLALFGLVCLAGWVGWFYFQGGFDYLMWLHAVPPRPEAETRFVTLAEDGTDRWADGHAGGDAACRRETATIAAQAAPATDWSGTVYSTYRVGTKAALVVRIGRYTALRTSYDEAADAVLLEPGSAVFAQAETLDAGDPVRFSGAIVADASGCAFQPDVVGPGTGSSFVFRFTRLGRP